MIDTIPHPTRSLKIMAGVARWSLGLLLGIWFVVIIAWGALHGWIVPRIGQFRPQLEVYAARTLGVAVRIGAIEARTEGLLPSVELTQVALLDAQGREALLLPRVVLALSPRSVLNGGFEQLYIDSPALDIRRSADGRIFIAGLAFIQDDASPGDSKAADWLFSQTEVLIQHGTVRWTDELRAAPMLALEQVDLVLRNGNWRHSLRLDATPPAAWGDRFMLTGLLHAPLFSVRDSNWQHWNGQLFANFSRMDVAQLRHHADIGIDVVQGHGALRAWADIRQGKLVGATADIALADVHAKLAPELQPLVLPAIQGRLGGQRWAGGFEFSTQALQFVTDEGTTWPGGNLHLRYMDSLDKTPAQGELDADKLDLMALARIASSLPLGTTAHDALRNYAPQGMVDELHASWKGPLDALEQYRLRGRIQGFTLGSHAQNEAPTTMGLRGATVDLDMSQSGGKASLAIASGALILPGVFEDPVVPLDTLNADVRWQQEGSRISVQAPDIHFANADAQGQARATWHTGDMQHATRFPGVLDLAGTLVRADGARVHRYLPLTIPAQSRHYVRDAVVAGSASNVQFRVKGDLRHLPFNDAKQGEFHIAARVKDVLFDYVPQHLLPAETLGWPALVQLSGELVFDRSSMQVLGASGNFAGSPGLRLSKVDAKIPDLSHTIVHVDADARGPLPELLTLMRTSALARMTGNALDRASGNGNADFQLHLSLPISNINESKVEGSVTLAGNELRITPDTPALARVRGVIQFNESGFSVDGMQARALGGDVRLDGGMRALPAGAPMTESAVRLRAQGIATAEGLQQTPQLGMLSQLAHRATGSTPYAVNLGFRRGIAEVLVTSSLQGLALALPAPLGKPADNSLPLRFETQIAPESLLPASTGVPPLHDQITLALGNLGFATYQRDLGSAQPRVLRGAIALGLSDGEAAPLAAEGVAANLQLGTVDVDAWEALLAQATNGNNASGANAAQDYLPTTVALRAREITMQGRTLHDVVAGGFRDGATWRANLNANELNGYVEYRPSAANEPAGGRLYARLSRVDMPQSEANQVEALIDAQPGALPALDIVVNDFELRGRKLGRVEIEAQNRGADSAQREWRLNKFNILAPEGSFTANGNWAVLSTAASRGASANERRTVLNFRLDIRDSGDLLSRFGMTDVVKRGKGRMEGQVAWMGAPFSPDYPSMTGQVNLNIEAGQFLKADPGLAKLLGVLSLQSLPRRLALDFRDVFSEGFAFDFVRGDIRVEQGVAHTNNLQMKGVNAAVLMEGSADIEQETQDLRVVVVPEINALTASLVATAINPVIGLGSFLAQVFLRGPLIEAATQEFRINGTWADPHIVRIARRGRGNMAEPPALPTPSSPTGDPS